jgi:hypothetical protein
MGVDRAMRTRAAAAAAVTIAALALAGCNAAAGKAGGRPGAGDAGAPASSPPVNVASPETSGPPPGGSPAPISTSTVQPPDFHTPPPATNAPAGDVVLTGAVHAGAEPSCLLLTFDKLEYLLVTPQATDLAAGDSVTVVGHVVPGIVTHCMQGMPFQVDKIVSISGPITTGPGGPGPP